MFEPRPLGLCGGIGVIDMELLSVIRRWHYRDHFSIREISRRTGLSRNTVREYLRSDTVERKFNIPDRPSKLDPYTDKLSQMLRRETGTSRKQSGPSSSCTPIWPPSATTAPTIAWRPSLATGRPLGNSLKVHMPLSQSDRQPSPGGTDRACAAKASADRRGGDTFVGQAPFLELPRSFPVSRM
jgi:hypothetical protein